MASCLTSVTNRALFHTGLGRRIRSGLGNLNCPVRVPVVRVHRALDGVEATLVVKDSSVGQNKLDAVLFLGGTYF